MCKGDDPTCAEFERHRLSVHADLARERRAFLKSGFAATGAAAAMATDGISLVSPALAQSSAARQPGQPRSQQGPTPHHATSRRSARHCIRGWMRVPNVSMPSKKSSKVSMMPFTPGMAATSSSIAAIGGTRS